MQYNRDYVGSSSYASCTSDDSASVHYGYKETPIIYELDYNVISKNLNKLSKETIEILKLIENKKFNEYRIQWQRNV